MDSGYLAAVSGADQAFTVGFDEGEHYSEVDRAKEVAQQAGLKHHIRIIGKQEFWDSLLMLCIIWMNLLEMPLQ